MKSPGVELSDRRRVLLLASPIVLAMGSQNLVNLIDIMMVSRLGEAALAAVGLGSFVVFTLQALTLGASTGVQILTARLHGAQSTASLCVPLVNALALAVLALPVASVVLYMVAPFALRGIHTDALVVAQTTEYAQARIGSLTFVAANFAFRGYFSAQERVRVFLYVMLIMHGANIVLNYLLIFGHLGLPAMGVAGAGWATTLSAAMGTAVYLFLTRHQLKRVLGRWQEQWKPLLRIALPYGVQQALITLGAAVLLWIIGQLGTSALAAGTVVINLMLLAILPAIGIGIATASLVSQSIGAGTPLRAASWVQETLKLAALVLVVIGIPLWVVPNGILSLFIADPATLALAEWPLRIVGLGMAFEGVGFVLLHALYSAGRARHALALTSGLQWIFFLPAAYWLGPVLGLGLTHILAAYVLYRAAWASALWVVWRRHPLTSPQIVRTNAQTPRR